MCIITADMKLKCVLLVYNMRERILSYLRIEYVPGWDW